MTDLEKVKRCAFSVLISVAQGVGELFLLFMFGLGVLMMYGCLNGAQICR